MWNADQQLQLEFALKKYPASMDKVERWNAIAEEVDGKSRKECVERYKFLREQVTAKKTNTAK